MSPKVEEDNILAPQDWTFPVPVAYGPGRLAEIGARAAAMGLTAPLIVTDRGSAALPFIADLQQRLEGAGLKPGLFAEISPNPLGEDIAKGRAAFRDGGHDAVIAIGGGSGMDGGKAIALTAANDIDLWAFDYNLQPPNAAAFPPLITIPTTSGTGAETESTAMVTHSGKGMKFCVWHPDLKPALALLDPALTVDLPRNLTAWTGADALTHAMEAYLVPGFHPLCDGMALEGLALATTWLERAVAEPQNMAARGGMMMGSCLAGIAFLKGLGLVHAISHMIGAEYDTHHGLTNAILLPPVLRFNLPGMEGKTKRMAEAMGLDDPSADAVIAEVERIMNALDIPHSLGEIGVPADCAQRIAEKAIQDSAAETNPRHASISDIRALTEAAILRARE